MRPIPLPPILAALIAFTALLLPTGAGAEVTRNLRYIHYDVQVRPGPLFPQVQAASPIHRDGRTFTGNTNWNVRWHYDLDRDPAGLCRVSRLRVSLDLEITLPRLHGASPGQQENFDRYLARLHAHEQTHAAIDTEAAHTVERELLALPPQRDCERLKQQLNGAGHAVLDRYRQKNREFDARTDHGRTEGVVLKG